MPAIDVAAVRLHGLLTNRPRSYLCRQIEPTRRVIKIGRPGYRVTKQIDPDTGLKSLLFEVEYPEIEEGKKPRHRFMSAFEQRVEPHDKNWQYLLFHADPYQIISFKVPSLEIDKVTSLLPSRWAARRARPRQSAGMLALDPVLLSPLPCASRILGLWHPQTPLFITRAPQTDKSRFCAHYDPDRKIYTLMITFKMRVANAFVLPPPPPVPEGMAPPRRQGDGCRSPVRLHGETGPRGLRRPSTNIRRLVLLQRRRAPAAPRTPHVPAAPAHRAPPGAAAAQVRRLRRGPSPTVLHASASHERPAASPAQHPPPATPPRPGRGGPPPAHQYAAPAPGHAGPGLPLRGVPGGHEHPAAPAHAHDEHGDGHAHPTTAHVDAAPGSLPPGRAAQPHPASSDVRPARFRPWAPSFPGPAAAAWARAAPAPGAVGAGQVPWMSPPPRGIALVFSASASGCAGVPAHMGTGIGTGVLNHDWQHFACRLLPPFSLASQAQQRLRGLGRRRAHLLLPTLVRHPRRTQCA